MSQPRSRALHQKREPTAWWPAVTSRRRLGGPGRASQGAHRRSGPRSQRRWLLRDPVTRKVAPESQSARIGASGRDADLPASHWTLGTACSQRVSRHPWRARHRRESAMPKEPGMSLISSERSWHFRCQWAFGRANLWAGQIRHDVARWSERIDRCDPHKAGTEARIKRWVRIPRSKAADPIT